MTQLTIDAVLAARFMNFEPYARFGIILGTGNVYTTDDISVQAYNIQSYQKWKNSESLSSGFNAVLGIAHPITHNLDMYVESAFNTIYFIPQKATLIQYTENGQDMLSQVSEQGKNMVYKKSISDADNNDMTKPEVMASVKYSFCSIVPSVGIRLHL
jgi:hypothetical protein